MKFYICLWLAVAVAFNAYAQDELDSLLNLSAFTEESDLQKQLNQSTSVASGKALGTRETPGIISVITADDISKSGARDITDILRLVPGFEIMQDLQFVTGVGFRGSWANEGKVLFLLDGQQVNELLFQTVPLINNFSVDAIEKIEIIRGPGSAIYGGSAEYAVINIITKQASTLNGVNAYGTGGFHQSATGRTNGGFMVAQKGEKFSWDIGAYKSKGIVSDQRYTDLYGDINPPVNLADATHANSTNLNLGFKAGNFSARGIYSDYGTNDPSIFITYKNYSVDLQYDLKINKNLTITPRYTYYNQTPWAYGDESTQEYTFKAKAIRNQGSLTFNQTIGRKISFTYGALLFKDQATSDLDPSTFDGGKFEMTNYALFGQGLYKHRLFNLTAGFRYENNSKAGDAFVPRLAFTKKIENFHFKLLYSEAFRTPSIQNINIAPNKPDDPNNKIVPERSRVGEIELGYQFTPDMLFSLNAFTLNTKRIIIYHYDVETDNEWYENFKNTGSRGLEAIYSIQQKKWNAEITYTYTLAQKTDSSTYYVAQTQSQYMGFPSHKFLLSGSYSITGKFSVSPSLIVSSKRYAYTEVDADDNPVSTALPSYALLNMNLFYKNIVKGLNASFAIYDLFNAKPGMPQPYNGGYLPIPGRSREYVIKLAYQFNFKDK